MLHDAELKPEAEHHAKRLLWQMASAGCTAERVQAHAHLKVWSGQEKQTSNMDSIQLNYWQNVSLLNSFCITAEKHLNKLKRILEVVFQANFGLKGSQRIEHTNAVVTVYGLYNRSAKLLEHSSPNLTNKVYTNVDPVLRQSLNQLPIEQWL